MIFFLKLNQINSKLKKHANMHINYIDELGFAPDFVYVLEGL